MTRLTLTAILSATLALSAAIPANAEVRWTGGPRIQLQLGDQAPVRPIAEHRGKARSSDGLRTARHPRRALPARCVDLVAGRRGNVRQVLSKRCLRDNFRATRRLPQQCERQVYAFGRYRNVYGKRCLNRFGWTVARHR